MISAVRARALASKAHTLRKFIADKVLRETNLGATEANVSVFSYYVNYPDVVAWLEGLGSTVKVSHEHEVITVSW
jgi:hypothetical protein